MAAAGCVTPSLYPCLHRALFFKHVCRTLGTSPDEYIVSLFLCLFVIQPPFFWGANFPLSLLLVFLSPVLGEICKPSVYRKAREEDKEERKEERRGKSKRVTIT